MENLNPDQKINEDASQPENPYFLNKLCFVANPISIDAALLPFEFVPDCVLRRATKEETTRIKKYLSNYIGSLNDRGPYFVYERLFTMTSNDPEKLVINFLELPESEWLYYIVEITHYTIDCFGLHCSASISDVSLDLSLDFP